MMCNIRSYILIATAFFAMNAPALVQTTYPAKPIRMVVPFSPGGTSDALARPDEAAWREAREAVLLYR